MNILHLTADHDFGGTESTLVNCARYRSACPELRQDFVMFQDGILRDQLLTLGVNVQILGEVQLKWPLRVLQARHAFQQILARQRYDFVVYHQHPFIPLALDSVAKRFGCLRARWFHNQTEERYWPEIALKRCNPGFPNLSIYCSEFIRRQIGSSGKGTVLYPPVPPNNASLSSDQRRALRRELGTPENALVITQVSRLGRSKGHREHIEALGRLNDQPDWVCWLVGGASNEEEVDYFANLQALARDLCIAERVMFLGKRDDIARLLSASDIYCQPNVPLTSPAGKTPEPPRCEAFGISIIEALYAGLPVVTSAIGGALEILDSSTGILVPAQDPGQLARELRRLLESPRLREGFRVSGPRRAREICDPASQVAKLGQLLKLHKETSAEGVRPKPRV
jgi:glycosyltransferase involved in cell wall biosynthesis